MRVGHSDDEIGNVLRTPSRDTLKARDEGYGLDQMGKEERMALESTRTRREQRERDEVYENVGIIGYDKYWKSHRRQARESN